MVAQCNLIYSCVDYPVTPNCVTWFGLSGSTFDECVANGMARNDRWEEDTDGLLEWGGCSEADADKCLQETEAQSCAQVEQSPYGPIVCGDVCGYASAAG